MSVGSPRTQTLRSEEGKLADIVQDKRGGSRIGQSPRSPCRPIRWRKKKEAVMDKESLRLQCRPRESHPIPEQRLTSPESSTPWHPPPKAQSWAGAAGKSWSLQESWGWSWRCCSWRLAATCPPGHWMALVFLHKQELQTSAGATALEHVCSKITGGENSLVTLFPGCLKKFSWILLNGLSKVILCLNLVL